MVISLELLGMPSQDRPAADDDDTQPTQLDELTSVQAYYLYVSHFLSMWNSRMYEFGAILLIQASFPGDLTASSINGIVETVCGLFFSSALGRWIDRAPSRLRTLVLNIIMNRATVVICCVIWAFLLASQGSTRKRLLFALVLLVGMVEKASRMANTLSIERDWVPVLASPALVGTAWTPFGLTHLNTVMRRIDITCKLGAPLAISALISASTHANGVLVIALSSGLSCGIEYWCVRQVWNKQKRLRAPKESIGIQLISVKQLSSDLRSPHTSSKSLYANSRYHKFGTRGAISLVQASVQSELNSLRYYFSTYVWIPSICAALLHASVLSFSGTFITYILNAGFSLSAVTVVKSFSAVFEISSTLVFPRAVAVFSERTYGFPMPRFQNLSSDAHTGLLDDDDETAVPEDKAPQQTQHLEPGVIPVGFCGLWGLFLNLIPVILALFSLDSTFSNPSPSSSQSLLAAHPIPILALFGFLSFSLLGRWTYDLATTQLAQALIPASHRSTFGGTEMAVVSSISLVHWVAAAIWHEQTDFKWLALASFVVVGVAGSAYWAWVKFWVKLDAESTRNGEVQAPSSVQLTDID